MNISILARNLAGKSITDLINNGSTNPNGYMQIRTGTIPASPQATATGTLLATLPFSNPAFGTYHDGEAVANPIGNDPSVAATGVAGWFRIFDRDGTAIMDGTITATDGGGDLEFDDINFIQGGTVVVDRLAAIMPM